MKLRQVLGISVVVTAMLSFPISSMAYLAPTPETTRNSDHHGKSTTTDAPTNDDLSKILIGHWTNLDEDGIAIEDDYSFNYVVDTFVFGYFIVSGKWTLSGQYVKFKDDESQGKFKVKVISPNSPKEIELIHLEGGFKHLEGQWWEKIDI